MAYVTNNRTAIELYIFASNDRNIMLDSFEPTARILERKHKRGIYDSDLSLKQWERVATAAAKAYCAEFGGSDDKWNHMFSVADRKDCARELCADFEGEISYGNGWL